MYNIVNSNLTGNFQLPAISLAVSCHLMSEMKRYHRDNSSFQLNE